MVEGIVPVPAGRPAPWTEVCAEVRTFFTCAEATDWLADQADPLSRNGVEARLAWPCVSTAPVAWTASRYWSAERPGSVVRRVRHFGSVGAAEAWLAVEPSAVPGRVVESRHDTFTGRPYEWRACVYHDLAPEPDSWPRLLARRDILDGVWRGFGPAPVSGLLAAEARRLGVPTTSIGGEVTGHRDAMRYPALATLLGLGVPLVERYGRWEDKGMSGCRHYYDLE